MEKILEKLIEKDNLKTPVRKNNFSNFEDINLGKINIKIFGIGGAGCKVIMNMCQKQRWDNNIQLFALDTDVKLLKQIQYANYECQPHLLGKTICRGTNCK